MSQVTDDACNAAILAAQPDRIQGFHYPPRYVIRDIWAAPGRQEIWECGEDEENAYLRFQHQCEVERTRVLIAAALPLIDPAGGGEGKAVVKQLEWHEGSYAWVSITPFGLFEIFHKASYVSKNGMQLAFSAYHSDETGQLEVDGQEILGYFPAVEDAKALAEARHINNVAALLTLPPSSDSEKLIEAAYRRGVEDAAVKIRGLRSLLHAQIEALDIGREDAVYDICERAVREIGAQS